jgi:hypothetical protein
MVMSNRAKEQPRSVPMDVAPCFSTLIQAFSVADDVDHMDTYDEVNLGRICP